MAAPASLDGGFRCINKLKGHDKVISSLKFSPDGKYLASASGDGTIRLWNPFEGKNLIKILDGAHTSGINDISWNDQSRLLCSAGDDNNIVVWDIQKGVPARTLVGHSKHVFCVKFSRNPSNKIVSGDYDCEIRIWSSTSGETLKRIPAHKKPITAVDFSPDGKYIVSSSFDGLCRIWDAETGSLLKTIGKNDNPPVACVRFVPNGRFIVTSTLNSEVSLWDFKQHSCKRMFTGHKNTSYCTTVLIWRQKEEAMIVCGSEDGCVYVWNLKQSLIGKLEHSGKTDVVLAVDVHPAGYLAAGSLKDPAIKIWKKSKKP